KVFDEDIKLRLGEINSILGKKYALEHPKKERDWRTYEQEFTQRIKIAMKDLDPLVNEAVSAIRIVPGTGHPHSLTLEQRAKLLLIKQLVGESNRMFANMLAIFSILSDIDVSYKTIERLYSDGEVIVAVHNLHVLILKKKGVTSSDATGDGTGYSLTVKKNYESHAQRLKDLAEENPDNKKEKDGTKKAKSQQETAVAYSFTLMDRRKQECTFALRNKA
ncbi:ISA1214-6 transposase, partial [mine drainage metagenome]